MSEIRIGIVGFGRMGRLRAQVLSGLSPFRLMGVCDIEPGLPDNPEVPVYRDYRALLGSDIDAVIVSTPNHMNAEVTLAALDQGKHVFCEKPPARSAEEMRRVLEAERRHPALRLKYGFNHRYHEAVQEAGARIASGRYGRLLWMRGVYGKSGGPGFQENWRNQRDYSGGGILIDQGIHMLDLFRLFAGDFVEARSFIQTAYWDIEVEDNAFVLLRSAAGPVAMLHSSATHWKHQFSLDIYLSEGYVQIDGILTQSRSYGRETLICASRNFAERRFSTGSPREEVTYFDQDASWLLELEDFARAIQEGRPITIGNSTEALRTLELVEMIYRSDPSWSERAQPSAVGLRGGGEP